MVLVLVINFLNENQYQEPEGGDLLHRNRCNLIGTWGSTQIADLKARIEAEKGFTVESMKLIFKGKTTANNDQLDKLGLKETDFLVVMNQVAVPSLPCRNHSPNPKLKRR